MSGDRYTVDPTFTALLQDLGTSSSSVLRRAGLPGDLFARGPIELTPTEYYALWRAVEDEFAERDHDGAVLAVEVGQAISVDLFSPPIFAALCSPDLATAARRLAQFKPLVGPLRLVVDDHDGLTITYSWPSPPPPPPALALTELVFWVALARIATRQDVRPARIEVAEPPAPADRRRLEKYLGTRVRTADRYAVSFRPADAHRRFLTENEQMWRLLAPDLRRRLHDLDAAATVAQRVRAALLENLPAGDPSVAGVTSRLATSSRTLQRQLGAEGTNFLAVLAATREDLARHYLTDQRLGTAEVAYLLGYDDTSSFHRAFKTWTGRTPAELRA